MAQGSYQQMLDYARRTGQAGTIDPISVTSGENVYGFTPSGGGGGSVQQNMYSNLVADFRKREESARAANLKRETEVRGIYGKQIAQYQEGGAFKAAGLAEIEQTKKRAVGAGTQQMISSGLYGTTTAASIPVQAEHQAGLARLKLEDILQQRTSQAQTKLAGFVERIEQPYPDYNMLLQASIAQGQR